jgi:hypothetical protein
VRQHDHQCEGNSHCANQAERGDCKRRRQSQRQKHRCGDETDPGDAVRALVPQDALSEIVGEGEQRVASDQKEAGGVQVEDATCDRRQFGIGSAAKQVRRPHKVDEIGRKHAERRRSGRDIEGCGFVRPPGPVQDEASAVERDERAQIERQRTRIDLGEYSLIWATLTIPLAITSMSEMESADGIMVAPEHWSNELTDFPPKGRAD